MAKNELKTWEKWVFLGGFLVGICTLFMDLPESEVQTAWVQWLPMVIGAVKGKMQGDANKKKMEAHDKFRKASIAYSPWTNMGDPGAVHLPGVGESMLSGAAQGAMVGAMGQDAGWWGDAAKTAKTAGNAAGATKAAASTPMPAPQPTAAPATLMPNQALQQAHQQIPTSLMRNDIYNQGMGQWQQMMQQPLLTYK